MTPELSHRSRIIALAAAGVLALAGCSAGSLGSSSGGGATGSSGGGSSSPTSITLLVDNGPATVGSAQQLVDDFTVKNPSIKISVQSRPGGADGDNLIKTRLATQTMDDVFLYNSGSLFQQIAPEKNLTPLTDESYMSDIDKSFTPQVSANKASYGVPFGTAFGGGVLYNKPIYAKLGLKVPKTWNDFIANSRKIKAAGIAPVIQTYQDTWTSQLLVLADFHNVAAVQPDFADKYTHNKVKYATDPVADDGFQHLQQIHDLGLENSNYASATNVMGLQMVATGKGAQYPMLSASISAIQQTTPDKVNDVGFFALPGSDAANYGMTTWFPAGLYVPKTTTGAKLAAVKKFLAFVASPAGCGSFNKSSTPTGPYMIAGCTLPADVPTVTKDVQAYFTANQQSPALEFVSPVKGPNLEQICVQVGSGITSAQAGAAQYDEDVKKQAQQLGLQGW